VDADLQQVIDAVGALTDGPGSPLIVMSPGGVRGNPYDPERFDDVAMQGEDVVLRLGRGHVQYVLEGASVADRDERSATIAAARLTRTASPHGGGPAQTHRWTEATLLLTWDPTLAESVLRTQGTFVRPQA
jgi:hypothetical protein